MTTRRITTLLAACAFLCAIPPAFADLRVREFNNGCNVFVSPPYIKTYSATRTAVRGTDNQVTVDVNDDYTVTTPGVPDFSQTCTIVYDYQYSNSADPPFKGDHEEGQTRLQMLNSLMQRLYGKVRQLLQKNLSESERRELFKRPTDGGGVRGSLGITLGEGSPAYVGFQSPPIISGSREVAFVVTRPGDGDALSIYYRDQLVWHQPLSAFEPGVVQMAELPESVFDGKDGLWTFWLESAGESNAEVFFPLEVDFVDGDADGVDDWDDNCPAGANPAQEDSDADGVGDACSGLPTIQASVVGTSSNGWYTSDVTVSWNIDTHGAPLISSNGCDATTVASDTAGMTLTCSATNASGISQASVPVRRDATAPVAMIASPANGSTYPLGGTVAASYQCSDGTSGIAACSGTSASGSPFDTASSGPKTFSVVAIDGAGHTSTLTVGYTVAPATTDDTPPVISPLIAGVVKDNGWYTTDVTVSWSVTDTESSISSQQGCASVGVTHDTFGRTFTCRATSSGGTTVRSVTIKRDAEAPGVVLLSPFNGLTYPRNLRVPALFACVDLISGPAQCSGTVSLGHLIDTATPASKSFIVTARDRAGNSRVTTTTYRVK